MFPQTRPSSSILLLKGLDGGFGGEAPSGSERVAFAQLIDRVFLLARSFNFRVPPYFISNVRALGELFNLEVFCSRARALERWFSFTLLQVILFKWSGLLLGRGSK